jgi:hypothetical protein
VQAAFDWVRIDIARPIRQAELLAYYPLYLAVVHPNDPPQHDLTVALAWACHPVGSRIAALRQRPAQR